MKILKNILLAALVLTSVPEAQAQHFSGLNILSPYQHQQICMGSSTPMAFRVTNSDTTARTVVVEGAIYSLMTSQAIYTSRDTMRAIPAGRRVDTSLANFTTHSSFLSELGAFRVIYRSWALDNLEMPIPNWPYSDSTSITVVTIRRSAGPLHSVPTSYLRVNTVDIPLPLDWVSFGATVVDGDSATIEPPGSQRSTAGIGVDSLHNPVFRLDRANSEGVLYQGQTAGDTIESFPINFQGTKRLSITLDYKIGGKDQYTGVPNIDSIPLPRLDDKLLLEVNNSPTPCDSSTEWTTLATIHAYPSVDFKSIYLHLEPEGGWFRKSGDSGRSSFALSQNVIDSNFRFRIRLAEANNVPWFVRNVTIQWLNVPEIEVMAARVVTPYTVIPFSATTALPVYARVKNYGAPISTGRLTLEIRDSFGRLAYAKNTSVQDIGEGQDTLIRFPDWDARSYQKQRFTVTSWIQDGYDFHSDDDTASSNFYLNVSSTYNDEYAYDNAGVDPKSKTGNDVQAITLTEGDGLGFVNTTGSYAVKFTCPVRDTLDGVRAYLGNANQAPDEIAVTLLTDTGGSVPGLQYVSPSEQTSFSDVRRGGFFNQFWPYYFPRPIVLEAGSYWVSVSQLTTDSYRLGGNLSRGRGALISSDSTIHTTPIYSDTFGSQWGPTDNNGSVRGVFAFEIPAGSGNWLPLMPETGIYPQDGQYSNLLYPTVKDTVTQATAILPMIRVLMTRRSNFAVDKINNTSGELLDAYPNPTHDQLITFSFDAKVSDNIVIEVFDELGRSVRRLQSLASRSGLRSITWDGKDMSGKRVAKGTYRCRLTRGDEWSTKLIVIE